MQKNNEIYNEISDEDYEALILAAREVYKEACHIVKYPKLAKNKQELEFYKTLVELIEFRKNNRQ